MWNPPHSQVDSIQCAWQTHTACTMLSVSHSQQWHLNNLICTIHISRSSLGWAVTQIKPSIIWSPLIFHLILNNTRPFYGLGPPADTTQALLGNQNSFHTTSRWVNTSPLAMLISEQGLRLIKLYTKINRLKSSYYWVGKIHCRTLPCWSMHKSTQ